MRQFATFIRYIVTICEKHYSNLVHTIIIIIIIIVIIIIIIIIIITHLSSAVSRWFNSANYRFAKY